MSDTLRIVLRPNGGITTEQAREARACAWAYVIRTYQSKGNPTDGQSGRGNSDGTNVKARRDAC